MNKKVNEFFETDIDGQLVYCIRHIPTGKMAIFDHDEEALEKVKEEIKRRKKQLTPRSKKDTTLQFGKSKRGYKSTAMAVVLFAHYHDMDLGELENCGYQIRHFSQLHTERKYEDCRSSSLYSTADVVMETESRKIEIIMDGKYLKVYMKPYGVTEYYSNAPGLLELIGRPCNMILTLNKSGRSQGKIHHSSFTKNTLPYMSMIAYANYHMGLTEDNYIQRLPEIMTMFQKSHYHIDHLDSNIHNHCEWNLSVMQEKINLSKHNRAARVMSPFFLDMCVTNCGEYRVEFGYKNNRNAGQILRIICDTPEKLRNFLCSLFEIDAVPALLEDGCTPQAMWKASKDIPHEIKPFAESATTAERLMIMSKLQFKCWENDSKIIVRQAD